MCAIGVASAAASLVIALFAPWSVFLGDHMEQ
jgi:hypothetical protein